MNASKALIAAVCLCAFAVSAQAVTVSFESDPIGDKPDGWKSVDSDFVAFYDTDPTGDGLRVQDFGSQGDGQSLANWDGIGGIRMVFDGPVSYLSLDFGNDDPDFSDPGALAFLVGYQAGSQVLENSIVMNRDDLMNQSIAISGADFDSALFYYAANAGQVIDNITFEIVEQDPGNDDVVPEPMTMAAVSAGIAGLAGYIRRRRNG